MWISDFFLEFIKTLFSCKYSANCKLFAISAEAIYDNDMFEVILFSLLGGVVSLLGAIVLFRNKKSAAGLAKYGTPFAAGVLLATAFTDLLPEALENEATTRSVMLAALLGMLVFFMLERYLRWFHHHP